MKSKKNEDLVSVVIPYYENKKFIKKSLMSAVNQTYKKIQIIMIYDENSRKNLDFIKKICRIDKRIKLIINKKNIGAGYSRNIGIKNSRGKYIAFLDSDDFWNRKKLEIQINYMKNNKYSASHTSYKIVDINRNYLSTRYAFDLNYKELSRSCDIGLSTVVIKRKLLEKFKKPFPKLRTKEDFVLWLNIAKKGVNFYGLDKTLTIWTNNPGSLSKSVFQKIKDAFRVYFFYQKLNFIKSIYFTFLLSINYLIKNNK